MKNASSSGWYDMARQLLKPDVLGHQKTSSYSSGTVPSR